MVSFQQTHHLLSDPNNIQSKILIPESKMSTNSSKKRKWEDESSYVDHQQISFDIEKRSKEKSRKSNIFHNIDLQPESNSPLPLEWHRCLDIQSGQIHFYNTKTNKRTLRDPRRSPDDDEEPPCPKDNQSLDLELNLTCESFRNEKNDPLCSSTLDLSMELFKKEKTSQKMFMSGSGGLNRSPSWLVLEEKEEEKQEMVATVCTRCYMLVILCKSSPECPNCKFMHPTNQNPPTLFKSSGLVS